MTKREIPLYATGREAERKIWQAGLDEIEPADPAARLLRDEAVTDILNFTTYTFPQYVVDPFHRHVATALNHVVFDDDDDYQYLMLFAPPQTGKSELVSTRLPPFFLAHNPDKPVALVSYGARLAERNSRAARAVMEDPRFLELPFRSRARPDLQNWRVYDWHLEDEIGYGLAVGIGGAISGFGFGLIVIDDPIESWAHAQSERIRETTWQWWQGTLKSRLWEGGKIILMQTRWHKDDLSGRILEEEGRIEEGGRWKVLSYMALAQAPTLDNEGNEVPYTSDILNREIGEAVAPGRYSAKYLIGLRDTMTKMVWNAEYQQMPTDPEGDFFKIGRIEIEDQPPHTICRIHDGTPVDILKGVRFWDLAATEKSAASRDPSYVSGTLVAEGERRWWILDEQRGQLAPEQVADLVKLTAKLDGKKVKIRIEQEPGSAGKTLIRAYQRLLAGYDVEGEPASGDKMTRAQGFATQVNASNVVMLRGDWNKAMLGEFAGFPNVAHDDQVDSAAGAFNEITKDEERWKTIKFIKV